MKNILVTGGTGFIGSALTGRLIKEGYNVTILTRKRLYQGEVRESKLLGANLIELSMSEISHLVDSGISFDTCYHFAWDSISGEDLSNDEKQLRNVRYCIDLLKALSLVGCNKFIGAGSFGQLELNKGMMLRGKERYYKCAKAACENFGKILANDLGIEFIWPLITNSFGEGEKSNRFINMLLKKLLRDEDVCVSNGDQLYDFIYIDDLVNAFYLIGKYGRSDRKYIIGSGNEKKHREWIENIPDIINSKGKLKFGEFEYDGICLEKEDFNISSLVEDTGFESKVSFEDGIVRTANYLKNCDVV